MNFRSRNAPQHPGIQLAPLVDVLLLLLIFFLLTWNAARNENELDVKVPKASAAQEKSAPIGENLWTRCVVASLRELKSRHLNFFVTSDLSSNSGGLGFISSSVAVRMCAIQ